MDDVLYEARLLAASGVKELIVVAQDTSRYGTDLPGHKRLLPELLRELCKIEELHWIRVHYVYPDEIDDAFIDVMAEEPKIVKYLDIPIQHCNSKILKLMNRRGDRAFLEELFAKLRARIPGIVLRTSVITGLPGEGEEEFAELCEFLKEQRLERVGAFPFSPEEGTPAYDMEHPDFSVAQARAEMVETIQSSIMDAYAESMLGRTLDILVDGYDEELEQFYGRSYADSPDIDGRVWIASEEPLREGDFIKVVIDGCADGDLTGYAIEEEDA
jgi:ribosomal protein S12 methylthiotransferase